MKYLTTKEFTEIIQKIHQDQKTKAGKPYFGHLKRVEEEALIIFAKTDLKNFERFDDYTESRVSLKDKVAQVSIGHDSFEDHTDKINPEKMLALKVHPHVVDAIKRLTKDKNEPYPEAIQRAKENPFAQITKRADNSHNSKLSRVSSLEEPLENTILRHTKYLLSYFYLNDKIDLKTFKEELSKAKKNSEDCKKSI